MSRRRLSQQQKRRIKHAQQSVNSDHPDNQSGTVISHHGGEVEIEPNSNPDSTIHCKFRANLGYLVCGDRVIFRGDNEEYSVIAVQPRQNLLQRLDGFGQIKNVAANITQLLVCLSVEPEPNLFLLDQYLLSAEQQSIDVLILLNKIDLLENDDTDPFNLEAIYSPLGYPILHTSVNNHFHIETLQQYCKDQVNVISGVSGVGKSSITKAIMPGLDIAIADISKVNKEGRHTTRTSRLYHLPQGGVLIDTPGVRGFNPVIDNHRNIADGFREISEYAQQCRFSNCRHINEPQCAVITAVDNGHIHSSRYLHYTRLLENCDN